MTVLLLLGWILCACPTGLWTFDCVLGKYKQNDLCKTCPRSCSRCISDALCTACQPGFYGDICTQRCSDSCSDGKCLQENGQCVSCAVGHYFGSNKMCLKCPDHCTHCQSQDICTACETGFTGIICQEECTNCNPVSGCNIETKVCFAGCKVGYSGPTCEKRCASKCNTCEPVNAGQCTSCAPNKYGVNCENTCSATCRDFRCNDDNGNCIHGCKDGFWGNKCKNTCSRNCRRELCHQSNGSCSNGCQGNFTGDMCRCPSNCDCDSDETCQKCSKDSSFVCDKQCSEFCVGSICSFETQLKCLYGCREGYRGSLCGSISSREETCTLVIVVCVAVSVVILMAVFTTFAFVVMRRKRVSGCLQNQNRQRPEGEELLDRNINALGADAHRIKYIQTNKEQSKQRKERSHEKLLDIAESYKVKADEDFYLEWNKIPEQWYKLSAVCLSKNMLGKFEQNGIGPYEFNRVIVKYRYWTSYYFNASYIQGKGETKATHIACIGPTTDYVDCFNTFWRMIWQENCHTIVMLNIFEKEKTERYWPNVKKRNVYSHLSVFLIYQKEMKNYTIRQFELTEDSEKRFVKQFQYKCWPEREAADNIEDLLEFLKHVQEETPPNSGPIVVHGKAGIGRTGTFIALDILSKAIADVLDNEDEVDETQTNIQACVKNLRKQRVMMVETLAQYKFIHQALVGNIWKLLEERANRYDGFSAKRIRL